MSRVPVGSILAIGACFTVAACVGLEEVLVVEGLIVIEGATLIDGTGAPASQHSAVVISGDSILRVGSVGDFRYPASAEVVDGSGMFIVPGFVDVHVHPRVDAQEETLRMLLAFGVTTIRIPGVGSASPASQGVSLRHATATGTLVGPRVFTGGKIIEGPTLTFRGDVEVHSEGEIRAEIRRQAELGVDLVKLYWNTPVEYIRAAVDEAHSLDLQVVGHLRESSWTEAARAGIDGLVHSGWDGPTWELVGPADQGGLRALDYPENYHRFAETADLDSSQFDSLVAALTANRVMVDPTLVTIQALYYGEDLTILERLDPDLAPPSIQATWGEGWELANPLTVSSWHALPDGQAIWPIAMDIVRKLHERGVNLAAGTDVGMPWITPGVSFHRELELLVEAGIPTPDVIAIATRNGARGLRNATLFGTIARGLSADLVLLHDDPIADIRNTRSIGAVYLAGQRYDPAELLGAVDGSR